MFKFYVNDYTTFGLPMVLNKTKTVCVIIQSKLSINSMCTNGFYLVMILPVMYNYNLQAKFINQFLGRRLMSKLFIHMPQSK